MAATTAARPLPRRRLATGWILIWALPLVAIGGLFYPVLGFALILCMLGPAVVALFRGRYWCGWICPRGAFADLVLSRVSPHRQAPAVLRRTWLRVALLAFLMTVLGVQLALAWGRVGGMGMAFVRILIVTTLAGVVMALIWHERAWCAVCPMGSLASWLARRKRPLQVSDACASCKACEKACPMQLAPHQGAGADCLKCESCIACCPKNALAFACDEPAA